METHDVIFLHKMFYQDKCGENAMAHSHIVVKVTKDSLVEAMPSEIEEEVKISMKTEPGSTEGQNDGVLFPGSIQSAQSLVPMWATATTRSGRLMDRRDGQYNLST